MSKIGPEEVQRLAALAQIGLSTDETHSLAAELDQIMKFVEQLQGVEVSELQPTDQVTGLVDVWRADEVRRDGLSREQLLANAPQTQEGFIKVKRVLG